MIPSFSEILSSGKWELPNEVMASSDSKEVKQRAAGEQTLLHAFIFGISSATNFDSLRFFDLKINLKRVYAELSA